MLPFVRGGLRPQPRDDWGWGQRRSHRLEGHSHGVTRRDVGGWPVHSFTCEHLALLWPLSRRCRFHKAKTDAQLASTDAVQTATFDRRPVPCPTGGLYAAVAHAASSLAGLPPPRCVGPAPAILPGRRSPRGGHPLAHPAEGGGTPGVRENPSAPSPLQLSPHATCAPQF
jgi:hypothetical protein